MEHKLEHSWKIYLTKFITGPLSLTKNKSVDQIWTPLSTIFMHKLMYTNFWKRLHVVFALDQYPAGANHKNNMPNKVMGAAGESWRIRILQHSGLERDHPRFSEQEHMNTLTNSQKKVFRCGTAWAQLLHPAPLVALDRHAKSTHINSIGTEQEEEAIWWQSCTDLWMMVVSFQNDQLQQIRNIRDNKNMELKSHSNAKWYWRLCLFCYVDSCLLCTLFVLIFNTRPNVNVGKNLEAWWQHQCQCQLVFSFLKCLSRWFVAFSCFWKCLLFHMTFIGTCRN